VPLISRPLIDKMSIVRAMISSLPGLLLRDATLSLSESVVIWGASAPARDDYSGDESRKLPLAQPLYLQS
jgi:hypothetical protein